MQQPHAHAHPPAPGQGGPAAGQQPVDTEAAQEAALRAKYGGLLPKKKVGLATDHKFFDSADWALSKQQAAQHAQQAHVPPAPLGALPPRLAPAPRPGGAVPAAGAGLPTSLLAPPKLEAAPRPRPGPSHLGGGDGG